jgi:hypothetical protein
MGLSSGDILALFMWLMLPNPVSNLQYNNQMGITAKLRVHRNFYIPEIHIGSIHACLDGFKQVHSVYFKVKQRYDKKVIEERGTHLLSCSVLCRPES